MVSNRNFFNTYPYFQRTRYIIDLVWAGKKHEVDNNILYENLEHGGLKLTNIPNKVSSQRIVWLWRKTVSRESCQKNR